MMQFITIIRSRMALSATQAFYLLVNNKSLASMSLTLAEVYRDYKDEDGFVYMTYASQEMFGCLPAIGNEEHKGMPPQNISASWQLQLDNRAVNH